MLKRSSIFVVLVCAIYIAARLWRLDNSCLWFDEIFSVHAAEHSWNSLFWFVAQDLIHPPLFYVLLKFWIGLGGESVFWLRLLPVAFSVLAIFPFVRLCRELKLETRVLYLSLFLLAVNGALIKYAQAVRMYSMLMFLGLVSMWLFARYFNRGKSFVPLVIANVLLVYTHYFGWLVVGAEITSILIFQRIKWRGAVTMLGVVAVSFIPWFVAVWQAARHGSDPAQNIAWQPRPGFRELLSFAIDLVEPFYFQASNAEPSSIYIISIPLLLIAVTVLAFSFIEWRQEEHKQSIQLLLLFVAVPLTVAFAASWLLPHSVWGTRHLTVILPPALVLIANATLSLRGWAIGASALLIIISLSVIAVVLDVQRPKPTHVWCAWDDIAEAIKLEAPHSGERTKVYVFEELVAYHLWYALRDTDRYRVSVVKGMDVRTDDAAYFLPRGFTDVQIAESANITDQRFWLAFRTSRLGGEAPLPERFRSLGYVGCNSFRSVYGKTTVIWMELKRNNCE